MAQLERFMTQADSATLDSCDRVGTDASGGSGATGGRDPALYASAVTGAIGIAATGVKLCVRSADFSTLAGPDECSGASQSRPAKIATATASADQNVVEDWRAANRALWLGRATCSSLSGLPLGFGSKPILCQENRKPASPKPDRGDSLNGVIDAAHWAEASMKWKNKQTSIADRRLPSELG